MSKRGKYNRKENENNEGQTAEPIDDGLVIFRKNGELWSRDRYGNERKL